MKYISLIVVSLFVLVSCAKENTGNSGEEEQAILSLLASDYTQLPEQKITRSLDNRVYAQYAMPTEKYKHGILGDRIEAGQLVVVVDGIFYEFSLADEYVFEDIQPRLFDVDGDNELEFITIRTNVTMGAGIAIYKIVDDLLVEFAHVPEIGRSNRWLNIVALNDLDRNGKVELVWIETPHIGGKLKLTEIGEGTLQVLTEKTQYSNHAIGERNLCLSVLTDQGNAKVFYVPNQGRDKILGFTYSNRELLILEEIPLSVDFSIPLSAQYSFSNILEDGNNCTNPQLD